MEPDLFKLVKEVSTLFHKETAIRETETWLRKVMHSQNTQKMFYKMKRGWRRKGVLKLVMWGRACVLG